MARQKLLTKKQMKILLENGARARTGDPDYEAWPVVKLFGGVAATWLVAELNPDRKDEAFGLADLGMGSPEMGYFSMRELASIRFPPFGLPIERDMYWRPEGSLMKYADAARRARRIVDL